MSQLHGIPEAELPHWMKQALRGIDWGILIVLALSLALAWSSFLYDSPPRTYWGESSLFRAADAAQALKEGRLYPRWSPHALYGYGAPIPHFLPNGTPYLIGALSLILDDNLFLAARLFSAFSLCLAACSTYALVARQLDSAAGVLAALAYVYSPFLGLSLPRILGDYETLFASALLACLLWALDKHLTGESPWAELLAIGIVALSCWVAPLLTGIALVFGVVFALWKYGRRALIRLSRVYLLGILANAFFWLPAGLESASIHWLPAPLSAFPFQIHLWGIFQPAQQTDPAALLQTPQLTLGLPALGVLAVLGAYRYLSPQGRAWAHLWSTLSLLIVVLIALFPSALWLLSALSFCVALLLVSLLSLRPHLSQRWRHLLLAACLLSLIVFSTPVWISAQPLALELSPSPYSQVQYELQGFGIAGLAQGAPVPTRFHSLPSPNPALIAGYRDQTLNRFGDVAMLANQASVLENSSHRLRFQLRSDGVLQTQLLLAYFEGWQAHLAGQNIELVEDAISQRASLNLLNSSQAELTLTLGTTPLRTLAWLVSYFSLAIALWRSVRSASQPIRIFTDIQPLSRAERRLSLTVLCLYGIIVSGLMWGHEAGMTPVSLREASGHQLKGAMPLQSRTSVGLEALAYRLSHEDLRAGETLGVTLYWQALRPIRTPHAIRLNLQSVADAAYVFSTPLRPPAHYPTTRWTRGYYVRDEHQIQLPSTLSAGRYILTLEVLECLPTCETGTPASFFDDQGTAQGAVLSLPRILNLR